MMEQHVRFITLGCKVNHYETQAMREALQGAGIRAMDAPENSDVDFVVINTCTVTHEADRNNRYWMRRARREHPKAKIIVTGCYVERNRAEIEALPEVDLVIGNQQKDEIAAILTEGCGTPEMQSEAVLRQKRHQYTALSISTAEGQTRAYIKIQDGCDHACSFCKVVLVRGRSRSRELVQIVEEAQRLCDAGYREIVLAGIQLGAYGQDQVSKPTLPDVLEACAAIPGLERIRLSSIEPTDVTDALIETMRAIPKVCPQLHIPLQSGDDEVLRAMNRRYDRVYYRNLITRLRTALPDFALTLDVMAGFAGETAEQFENTVALLREVRPLKCHVFPYSPREGTRAARFEGALPPAVMHERVQRLMTLGENLGRQYSEYYVGRTLPVLVEGKKGPGGLVQGHTANYLKVCFQGDEFLKHTMIPVQLLALQGTLFLGKPIYERAPR